MSLLFFTVTALVVVMMLLVVRGSGISGDFGALDS